jgi:hypothetical protein
MLTVRQREIRTRVVDNFMASEEILEDEEEELVKQEMERMYAVMESIPAELL